MISKGLRGARLGGLVKYLFGPGRYEEHTNQHVVACSDPTWVGTGSPDPKQLQQLIAELDDPMVRYGDRTKQGYVYHVVVSIPEADGPLREEQWRETAQTFADRLGLDEHVQWVAIHHGLSANGNDHIHLVANLMRDDGRTVNLWQERIKRRGACVSLEERYGLTATSPAGLGQESLTRREVEQLRGGQAASVTDLTKFRVATVVRAVAAGARSEPEFVERLRGEGLIVRARRDDKDPAKIGGYSVAARGGDVAGKLVWYGGGKLGRDLRLPALRTRWGQSDEQRKSATDAWFSDAAQRRKAEPRNLAGAAEALREAASRLQKVPPEDRFSWYIAATESAGVVAAAASVTTDDRLRGELIKAWQAINRATPTATTLGVTVAPGDSADLRVAGGDEQTVRPAAAWPEQDQATTAPSRESGNQEISSLLAGASRVLMASRLADAPQHAIVQALLVQAVQLAAQISRTIAARQGATQAQQRAAAATARAAELAATSGRPGGWQFTRTGAEVLDSARTARAVGADTVIDMPRSTTHEQGPQHPEQGR